MEREPAQSLAKRIGLHWGSQLTASQVAYWAEELEALDEGAAGTAFARLKTSAHRPTLGQYLEVYKSLNTHDASTRKPPCKDCADTGLITDMNHPAHWPGDPKTIPPASDWFLDDEHRVCGCNVATWCRTCDAGVTARGLLQRTK